MFSMETWRVINIVIAAIGQTSFVVLYMTFPWWRSFLGRALFFKAVTFCVLVDVAVAGRIGDWPKEDLTFVILYGVLGIGIWAQFFAFLHVTLTQNRSDWEKDTSEEDAARSSALDVRESELRSRE